MDYEFNKTKYLALIGHVQGGKTFEEINYCYLSVFTHKLPVIFIVRNIIADQLQLLNRFTDFNKNSERQLDVKVISTIENNIELLKSKGVLLLLCNSFQLKKIKELLMYYQGEYNLCIDEVDFSIKTKDRTSCIDKYLSDIKLGATHILGATATPVALFSSQKKLTKIKRIGIKTNYHGIDSLKLEFIKPVISDLFPISDSEAMCTIYDSLLLKDRCVLLHTVTKKKNIPYSSCRVY